MFSCIHRTKFGVEDGPIWTHFSVTDYFHHFFGYPLLVSISQVDIDPYDSPYASFLSMFGLFICASHYRGKCSYLHRAYESDDISCIYSTKKSESLGDKAGKFSDSVGKAVKANSSAGSNLKTVQEAGSGDRGCLQEHSSGRRRRHAHEPWRVVQRPLGARSRLAQVRGQDRR